MSGITRSTVCGCDRPAAVESRGYHRYPCYVGWSEIWGGSARPHMMLAANENFKAPEVVQSEMEFVEAQAGSHWERGDDSPNGRLSTTATFQPVLRQFLAAPDEPVPIPVPIAIRSQCLIISAVRVPLDPELGHVSEPFAVDVR